MNLTYDTLLHIISVSWYAKDAVHLMATCRVLYHEGPKIALKKAVLISTVDQLASFLKFLRADNWSRCRYLRQLASGMVPRAGFGGRSRAHRDPSASDKHPLLAAGRGGRAPSPPPPSHPRVLCPHHLAAHQLLWSQKRDLCAPVETSLPSNLREDQLSFRRRG